MRRSVRCPALFVRSASSNSRFFMASWLLCLQEWNNHEHRATQTDCFKGEMPLQPASSSFSEREAKPQARFSLAPSDDTKDCDGAQRKALRGGRRVVRVIKLGAHAASQPGEDRIDHVGDNVTRILSVGID